MDHTRLQKWRNLLQWKPLPAVDSRWSWTTVYYLNCGRHVRPLNKQQSCANCKIQIENFTTVKSIFTAPTSPPARGLRERCNLQQRGPRRIPGRRKVFLHYVPPDWDCLSRSLLVLTIFYYRYINILAAMACPHQRELGVHVPCVPQFRRLWFFSLLRGVSQMSFTLQDSSSMHKMFSWYFGRII